MKAKNLLFGMVLANGVHAAIVEQPLTLCVQSGYRTGCHAAMTADTTKCDVCSQVVAADSGRVCRPSEKKPQGTDSIAVKPDIAPAAQDSDSVYTHVDEPPQFPGGYKAMQKYFQENLFKR